MPGAISKVTTELIGPFLMDVTLPERMLRALIFLVGVMLSRFYFHCLQGTSTV